MKISSNKKTKVKASRPFSKLASKAYTQKQIEKKSLEGEHNGESMELIFKKIMNDPNVELGDSDKSGNQTILYNGKDIGWLNPNRGIGWVDEKAYDKIQPYTPSETNGITSAMKITSANKIETRRELQEAIEDIMDAELCGRVLDVAYSEDGTFETDYFIPTEDFFEYSLVKEEAKDVALKFFNGSDLDTRGPANPNRNFFRFDGKDNVESTDDPDAIYFDTILDNLIEYILDHLDDRDFPKPIQKLIDEYLENEEEE